MRGRTFLKRALVIFAVCLAFGVGVWTGSRSQTLQEAAPAQTEPPQESVSVQPEPSAPAVVEPDKKPSAQSTPTSGFQAEAVEQQLKTKTHLYKNYGTWFVFLVVENTSEYTLDISVDAVARNAEAVSYTHLVPQLRAGLSAAQPVKGENPLDFPLWLWYTI